MNLECANLVVNIFLLFATVFVGCSANKIAKQAASFERDAEKRHNEDRKRLRNEKREKEIRTKYSEWKDNLYSLLVQIDKDPTKDTLHGHDEVPLLLKSYSLSDFEYGVQLEVLKGNLQFLQLAMMGEYLYRDLQGECDSPEEFSIRVVKRALDVMKNFVLLDEQYIHKDDRKKIYDKFYSELEDSELLEKSRWTLLNERGSINNHLSEYMADRCNRSEMTEGQLLCFAYLMRYKLQLENALAVKFGEGAEEIRNLSVPDVVKFRLALCDVHEQILEELDKLLDGSLKPLKEIESE